MTTTEVAGVGLGKPAITPEKCCAKQIIFRQIRGGGRLGGKTHRYYPQHWLQLACAAMRLELIGAVDSGASGYAPDSFPESSATSSGAGQETAI